VSSGPPVPVADRPKPTRASPAAELVTVRLLDQIDVIRGCDPLVRQDAPDAVHRMRVAVRRVREALATCRPLFVGEQTEPVRLELGWLAAALGEPRDAEVMRERLARKLADEPLDLVRSAGYVRIDEEMRTQYEQAHARMLEALASDRYASLLDGLDQLAARPPWTDLAARPVHQVLPGRVRHDYRRLAERVAQTGRAADPQEREHRLHEARKAAKRVRYAAEMLTGVYGDQAREFVRVMNGLQSVLGDHHDAFVTQERLRELADQAASTGDNAFVFGVLHAREERALLETDHRFVRLWVDASKKKHRRWLSG
jgi:CHAD domain-containing protein